MSWVGILLFSVAATFAIGGAVATVASRNPLRAAMGLLLHIISLSGLFLTLHAELLAAIQLLVYAGAVVVLFIFVIMLIGPAGQIEDDGKPRSDAWIRWVSGLLASVVTVGLAFTLIKETAPYVLIAQCADGDAACSEFGGATALGRVIYTEAVVPFELISILLLVAIVGAIAVARGRTPKEIAQSKREQAARELRDAELQAREAQLSAEVSAHGGH